MFLKKMFFGVMFIAMSSYAMAYDNLVENEAYFKQAIEKSKESNFGDGRVIAVLDTGINDDNLELRGKVIAEYDFTTDSKVAMDKQGHGTKMASVIASANDGNGITGVAYNAKLIDVKVVADNGSISTKNIIKGIEFAANHGANVINMSFSSGEYSKELEEVIEKYAKKGIIFVAAAGNDGENAVAYPAGYKSVIAVSSLDRKTGKRAIYANYGKHINEYIKDGIWTYDGKKYSREYGTSEACAVVSGYSNKSLSAKNENNKIELEKIYKLATPSSVQFDEGISPFADSNENKYIYDLANYNLMQLKFKAIIPDIEDLKLGAIPSFSTNPFTTLNHDFNIIAMDKANAYLVLFDLFGEYSKYAYKKDKSHKVAEILNSDVNKYKKLLEPLITDFKSISNAGAFTSKFFKTLDKLVLSTKGKTDPLSRTIRKWANYATSGIYNKDITKYKTKYIEKNIIWNDSRVVKIGKALKMLKSCMSAYDNATKAFASFTNSKKQISLFSIYAVDYLVALEAMPVKDKKSKLTKEVLKIVDDALNDSAKLEELMEYFIASAVVDIFREVGGIPAFKALFGKATGILKDTIKKKVGGGIGADTFIGVVTDIITDTATETSTGYMYLLYLDLVVDVQDRSFFKTYKEGLKVEDLSNNLLSVSILQKFTYHSLKYLVAVASNPLNVSQYDKQQLKDLLSNYTITEYGTQFKFDEPAFIEKALKVFEYGTKNVISNFAVNASQAMQASSKYGVKTLDWIFNTNAADNLQPIKNIEAYFDYTEVPFLENASNYDKLEQIFEKYNDFSKVMTDYKDVLANLFSNKTVVDAVYFSNKSNNEKIEAIKNIVEYNDKFIPIYDANNNVIDIDYKEGLMLYQKETMDTLMTKQMLIHKDNPINRKLFTEMMLKALDGKKDIHKNPFDDTGFLLDLFKGDIFIFNDIDNIGVTLNEKLWVEYGKYSDIVNGYDGERIGDFGPNGELARHQAMIIVGKILKKNGYSYDSSKVRDIMVKNSMQTNHWDIYNKHEESIGLCIQEGIIQGYKSADNNSNPVRRLGLNDPLSFYQSSIIAKRLYQRLHPKSILNEGKTAGDIYDKYYDYIKPTKPTYIKTKVYSEIPVVESGKEIELKAEFNLDKKYLDRIGVQWKPLLGNISNFDKIQTNSGEIASTIIYKAPLVDKEVIIPIVVKIQLAEHDKIRKKYYVRVVPSNGTEGEALDPTKPNTVLSAQYIDGENKFKISWNANNTQNLEILYSYDKNTWSRFALLNLDYYNGTSDTETINDSKLHDTIYFKAVSSKGSERTTSSILSLAYSAQTQNTGGKDTEIPVKAELKSLKEYTRHNYVYPSWYIVKDSHGNDNAVKYEVSYADNYRFENDTKVMVTTGRSVKIENLQDDKRYYFRVRAINHVGTGEWSSYESTTIDVENLPTFSSTPKYPTSGATGVSKTPTFRWDASDKDGDELEYYVRIGTDRENLNYKSGWIEGRERFDFADKFSRALKPNTTYYWQVTYREGHRTPEYYGGEYPTSPIWSFTTEGTGPDLAVTNVRMIGDVKIDEWVLFEVTVKNNGSEVAEDQDIKPYFVKNGIAGEFAAYKRGRMNSPLNPGEEAKVIVKVQFSNKLETRDIKSYVTDPPTVRTVEYDNILVDGSNTVRFALDYNQFDVDINSANDSKDCAVTYSLADNLPVIDYADLVTNVLSDRKGDRRYMLGWEVTYQVHAEDQVKIDKYEMEYRTSENDIWHHIQTYTNSDNSIAEHIAWTIPNRLELVTQTMQLRVKVYNPSGLYSSVVSPQFKVFENDINVDELYVDKSKYKLGEPMTISYSTSSKYDIESFKIRIKQDSDSETLYEYKSDTGEVFYDSDSFTINVPNEARLLGTQVYLEAYIIDENGAYKKVESSRFELVQNTDVPKVFSPYEDIFTEQYNNFPSNSTNRKTENYIKKLIVDDNGLVHMIVEQIAWWWGKDSRGHTTYSNRNFRYYYMTYNPNTKYKSTPKLVFENQMIDSGNLPDEGYRDFILNGNVAIMITSNSNTKKLKMYKVENGSLQVSSAFNTDNYGYGQLKNHNGKTYIAYTTDDSVQENRRLKRKELYPNFGGSDKNVLNEYLGRNHRIHGDEIYFYEKGIFYKLNSDMTVIPSTKQDIGVQVKYVKGKVDIFDSGIKEVLFDENRTLILYFSNGLQEKISSIKLTDYETDKGLFLSVYTDKIIVCHYDESSKKFKVITYDRIMKNTEVALVGNKAYSSGKIYDIVKIKDKKIIIGNPDGEYDYAAQIITADLSNGLSSVPSIEVTANRVANIGTDTTLTWTLSKESDKLSNFKVYKVSKNGISLLTTISDTSVRSYIYQPNDVNEKSVTLKVVANYSDGESSFDQVTLQVLGNVTFNSFSTNVTDLNLYEDIEFVWSVSGANSNNIYTLQKKCEGENSWTQLFETKETREAYKIGNFSGVCQFKVVSGDKEKILDYPVTINGDVFRFKDDAFAPVGNYQVSEGKIKFNWDTYFNGDPTYNLYVKKAGSGSFELLTSTASKEYEYIGDLGNSFIWKVSFEYNGRTVTSKEMNVVLGSVANPSITQHQFIMDNNSKKVSLVYSLVTGATEYEVYRSQYNNNFIKVGTTTSTSYEDTLVEYGATYKYYVIAVKNGVKSLPSSEVSVETIVDTSYEVIIDTDNYQTLNSNKINLQFRPNKTVSFEQYEVLLGTSPDELFTYSVTNSRSLLIDGLDFAKTYYVEIYPLNPNGKRVSTLPAKLTFTTGFDTKIVTVKASISIDEVSTDHVSLSWGSVPNADSYTVCRSEDNAEYECLEIIDEVSYTDSINLEEGKKYKYIVKASNDNGFTVSDESISVTPIPLDNDMDNDGIPDNLDPDIDGDGTVNAQDTFPRDASEWLDTDGDGIGNNADTDDDNDGVLDTKDDLPLNANESVDTDGDGTGNNADRDDDNDGISDADENKWGFDPLDASDGGNADADGDGVSNADEIEAGSDPLDPSDTKKPKRFVPIMMDDLMIMVPYVK